MKNSLFKERMYKANLLMDSPSVCPAINDVQGKDRRRMGIGKKEETGPIIFT
jgi:hypothetical protein